MMYKRILFLAGIVLLFLFAVSPVSARLATPESTQISWPTSPMGTTLGTDSLFHHLIKYLYEWGISLGGIAVFIMLLAAGIQYLTSAGDPGKMGAAMTRIRSAILGLVLLLTSWLILNTINPQFVQLRELPFIWDEAGFAGIKMVDPNESIPPCDIVVVYSEVGFEGDSKKPIVFGSNEEIIKIEGSNLDQYSLPWSSARNLIELDESDIVLIEKNRFNQPRFNNKGEEKTDGEYKEGGACMIDLFYTTRKWWGGGSDVCGGRLARVQLPSRDITESKFQDQSITCAEVRRALQD